MELAAGATGVIGDSNMGRPRGAAIEADCGGHALGPTIGVAILLVDTDHVAGVGRVDLDPRLHLGVGKVGPRAVRRAPRQRVADRRVHRQADAQRHRVGSGHPQHHHPDDPDNRTNDPGHHRHLPTETSPRTDGTPRSAIRHRKPRVDDLGGLPCVVDHRWGGPPALVARQLDAAGVEVDGVVHVPEVEGASLALALGRRAVVPHGVVDHELVATLEQVDETGPARQCRDLTAPSSSTIGSRRRAAAIASPSRVCAFSRTSSSSRAAWPGGQVDDWRLAGEVGARVAGRGRHGCPPLSRLVRSRAPWRRLSTETIHGTATHGGFLPRHRPSGRTIGRQQGYPGLE